MIIPEENMPYTKDGIRPDIIINPHAIPSRMTIGHLVECIFAKLCCIDGLLGDANVFIPIDQESIYNGLENNNFNKYGNEILYNGYTGTQIDTEIFLGPTFYFRLKHMVAEKMNSRGVGKVVGLTRQPTEGRRKGGGLRIGEMERDTILSHGISNFVKESMMERSDKFCWCICKRCGTLVSHNIKENINTCNNCNNDDVAVIQTPYAFKLFIQELETMGVQPRLNTEMIDMPIDQRELVRGTNARGDDEDDDGDGGSGDDGGNGGGDDSDDSSDSDIDYTLFNSQVDNFATKNTIVDEKQWADTYDKHNDKIKGGANTDMGFYEEDGDGADDDVVEVAKPTDEEDEEDEEISVSDSEDDEDLGSGGGSDSGGSSIGGELEEELFEDNVIDANVVSDASVYADDIKNTIEDVSSADTKRESNDDIKYVIIV